MIREFTFGIVTYNSEQTVVETLESIKYQIKNHGDGIKFYLVVSDDSSTDNTLQIISDWLEVNETLFVKTMLISTPQNSGLCINYSQMINAIETEHFIEIAGDDVISSVDVFKQMSDIAENEIRIYFPVYYNGDEPYISEDNIGRQLFYKNFKHTNRRDIHLLETLNPYSSTEVCFLKKNYTKESMDFIKQYRNFEDDTSLYYIMTHNNRTYFSFRMDPFILYRKTGESMTTSVDNANQIRFLDDLYNFRKYTMKNEKNIFVKMFIALNVWDTFLMKHRFNASKSLYRKIRKTIESKRIEVSNSKDYQIYSKALRNFLGGEKEYLKMLRENRDIFLEHRNN